MSLDITWWCAWFCKNNSNFCTSQDSQTQLYSQVCFALNSQCSSSIVRNKGIHPTVSGKEIREMYKIYLVYYLFLHLATDGPFYN